MTHGATVFDVCVWFNTAVYLRSYPCSEAARVAALRAPHAPPAAKLVLEALEGKHGKVFAHSHIWSVLERQLATSPTSGVSAQEAPVFTKIFKSYVTSTGGNPELAWLDDRKTGEMLVHRYGVPDFEDARVAMGALAVLATLENISNTIAKLEVRVMTHDYDFARDAHIPGIAISFVDPLTPAQRATRRMELQQASRRRWLDSVA
jgi:hypothetical protein